MRSPTQPTCVKKHLTEIGGSAIIFTLIRGISSAWLERLLDMQKVTGPSPVSPTIFKGAFRLDFMRVKRTFRIFRTEARKYTKMQRETTGQVLKKCIHKRPLFPCLHNDLAFRRIGRGQRLRGWTPCGLAQRGGATEIPRNAKTRSKRLYGPLAAIPRPGDGTRAEKPCTSGGGRDMILHVHGGRRGLGGGKRPRHNLLDLAAPFRPSPLAASLTDWARPFASRR